MSRDKLIIIGVVVLGAARVPRLQASRRRTTAIGQPPAAAKDFPTISAPDDIDKISITNGDKGEVVLEKVADPDGAAAADGGAGDDVAADQAASPRPPTSRP